MTSKEAVDKIKHIDLHGQYPYPYYLKDDLEYKEAIEALEQLVERDTPKKVYSTDYHYCPNCDTHYLTEYQKFCDYCGQRLDWSE